MKIPWKFVGLLLIGIIVVAVIGYAALSLASWEQYKQSHSCLVGQVNTHTSLLIRVDAGSFSDWTSLSLTWPNGTTRTYSRSEMPFSEPQDAAWSSIILSPTSSWRFSAHSSVRLMLETNSTLELGIYDQDGFFVGTMKDGMYHRSFANYGPFFRFANRNALPITVALTLDIDGPVYLNPYQGSGCYVA